MNIFGTMLREIFKSAMSDIGEHRRYQRPKGLPRGMDLNVLRRIESPGRREVICDLVAKPSKYMPHYGAKERGRYAGRTLS